MYCHLILSCQSSKVSIGIEAGPNCSFLRGNEVLDEYNQTKTAYSSGLKVQYNFSKTLSLKTGIGFEQKGSFAVNYPVRCFVSF